MTGKKKIVFLEYFPSLGGGQSVLLRLIDKMRHKYDVSALIFKKGHIEKELNRLKIKYSYIPSPKTVKFRHFFPMLMFQRKLITFLKTEKPNLIYANNFFSVKLSADAACFLRIPLIWHKHIIIDKAKNSYLARQIRHFSRLANKIICVSGAVKDSLSAIGVDEDRLIMVHNGMEIKPNREKNHRNKIRKKHGFSSNFVAGTVGFLRGNKGFDILIKAAALIKEKNRNIKFLITGSGEDNDTKTEYELKKLADDLDLRDTVVFAGYQDKDVYMPAFDAFVLPSPAEPFGLVTIEAMAKGLPVIAFNTGGTKEIIKNNYNGFLADKVNEALLAEKIMEVYKKRSKLAKIKRNAIKTVKEKFNLSKQTEKIGKIIDNTLGISYKSA